jgi:hypothetical protein
MALKDEKDSRPVNNGDLVAAQWYPDETYYIGEVDVVQYGKDAELTQVVKNIGGNGEVDMAYHIVKLMDADKWKRVIDDCSQRMFDPVVKAFPMVKTGDYSPEDTILLDEQIKMAVIKWLHWNYPKE